MFSEVSLNMSQFLHFIRPKHRSGCMDRINHLKSFAAHRGEVSNKISHRSRQFKYKNINDCDHGSVLKKHFKDTKSVRVLVMEIQVIFKNSMME
jgi:hypothetical protein